MNEISNYLMKFSMNMNIFLKIKRGFIALTAVMVMIAITAGFSFLALSTSVVFADMVFRKEVRNQVNLNLLSCIDMMATIYSRDYFISGKIYLEEFGCQVSVANNFAGMIDVSATSSLANISSATKKSFQNDGSKVFEINNDPLN